MSLTGNKWSLESSSDVYEIQSISNAQAHQWRRRACLVIVMVDLLAAAAICLISAFIIIVAHLDLSVELFDWTRSSEFDLVPRTQNGRPIGGNKKETFGIVTHSCTSSILIFVTDSLTRGYSLLPATFSKRTTWKQQYWVRETSCSLCKITHINGL